MVILNWEVDPPTLRVHDPATNAVTSVPAMGAITAGEWHGIVWEVRATVRASWSTTKCGTRARATTRP